MAGRKQVVPDGSYVVANPRGLPRGIPIISWQDKEWFEGDEFAVPSGLSNLKFLVAGGYISEVRNG